MDTTNSYQSRIQGMTPGNLVPPVQLGVIHYHLMFDTMDNAWDNVHLFAPTDNSSIITTPQRPNMHMLYNPLLDEDQEKRIWKQWQYFQYYFILNGFYGNRYYLFGSGKVFLDLPSVVD